MLFKTVIFLLFVTSVSSARILAVVPTPAYSHQISFRRIWRELLERGHEITLITANPMNDPTLTNLTEISVDNGYELYSNLRDSVVDIKGIELVRKFREIMVQLTEYILSNKDIKEKLMSNKTSFDLVMVESIFSEFLAFAEIYQCPKILISSFEALNIIHSSLGNPVHPVVTPEVLLPYYENLNFLERIISTIYHYFFMQFNGFSTREAVIRKYFGNHIPSIQELVKDVDMLFLNVNPLIQVPRAVGPSTIIYGGGFHLDKPKQLPQDLEKYLDDAKEGVIYFSLGSNVKSGNLNEKKMNTILETLGELPYKVLWKFEKDTLPGKPDNIKLIKWAPQQDVLRHPNIKVFITQGGLQSLEEALFNYVPMVVLPFFGDQASNAKRIEQKGIGRAVVHQPSLLKNEFKATIIEVIQNPKYRENMKELARLALDQPMSGIDKVVWWTEYVIRNKGAKHLRNPIVDLPLYQYYLLDVFAFIICSIVISLYLLKLLVKFVFRSVNYLRNLKSVPIAKKSQ